MRKAGRCTAGRYAAADERRNYLDIKERRDDDLVVASEERPVRDQCLTSQTKRMDRASDR